jgi:serine/threonine protein kinase
MQIERQISIWKDLKHDNIVPLEGIFKSNDNMLPSVEGILSIESPIYIVSRYAIYGNALGFLQGEGHRAKWASLLVLEIQ